MTLFQGVSACSDCLRLVLTVWFSYSNLIPHLISAALIPYFSPVFLGFFCLLYFFLLPSFFFPSSLSGSSLLLHRAAHYYTISNTELVRISSNGYLSCGIIEVIFNKHVHFSGYLLS